jgi:S1-C subfamily serine protease
VGLAILFGIVASGTFVVCEPRLYKLYNKEDKTKTTVSFPTEIPVNAAPTSSPVKVTQAPTPEPVIVEQSIKADLNDYLAINNEIRKVSYEVQKSLLNISSTFTVNDWFGKSEKTVNTTGVVIYNNMKDILVLVSLDKVRDAKSIKIEFSDTISADAELQACDSDLNLAVRSVPIVNIPGPFMNGLKTATLGESYSITVGDPIIALGSPNGHSNSMDIGIVTSKGSYAEITDNRLDLFNTSVNKNDNSDGIIVNLDGKIIGLITRTLKDGTNRDLNTAIGISELMPVITAMCNETPRVYFGVKTDDMTAATMQEYDVSNGIYVNDVDPDSPAFIAGIQNGDIIRKINEEEVSNTNDFNEIITEYKPGDELTVDIKRGNSEKDQEINLSVELAEKKNK